MDNLMNASCRVAFAGMIHDLGKFVQRAGLDVPKDVFETHLQLFCPRRDEGYWTHQHAAWTAVGFDALESALPDLLKSRDETFPFSSRADGSMSDSLVGVAARHHNPDSFLDWIVATADRVASGFEREEFEDEGRINSKGKDYLRTRLLSLFEQISLEGKDGFRRHELVKGYPLKPLSAEALMPADLAQLEAVDKERAKEEYRRLWDAFISALDPKSAVSIPGAFRRNWELWLDVFDSAWLAYTHAIPSATAFGVKPDVSLYDHSKAVAAIAVALWRWHHDEGRTDDKALASLKHGADREAEKFLLVQGDFFGIQNFIFSEGSQTNKKSAKVLRGRSFYVSLLSELAALKILQALQLPSTSQINNAAGRFLIVAPNTESARRALERVKAEIAEWFVANTLAEAGLGIAVTPASCADFYGHRYSRLQDRLHEALEKAKYQRFDLVHFDRSVLNVDYSNGVCDWQQHLPADGKGEGNSCALSRDQMLIGEAVVGSSRILVLDADADIHAGQNTRICELPVFGYRVAFVQDRDASGVFGRFAADGKLFRCWDFSLPESSSETLWHGFARRNISGYVPRYDSADFCFLDSSSLEGASVGQIKTFEHIAAAGSWDGRGIRALMTLKGDVDDLGTIFRFGLCGRSPDSDRVMTFAKTASLSRQFNAFFAVCVPLMCRKYYPNMYTVFAGGDDFFLIGPWREAQHMALRLRREFSAFVADNPEVHFSAGLAMTKSFIPVRGLSEMAEEALVEAKSGGKNRVSLYGRTVTWSRMEDLEQEAAFLSDALDSGDVGTSFLYGLFEILEMAQDKDNPRSAVWHSRLYYAVTRLFERGRLAGRRSALTKEEFLQRLLKAMELHGADMRVALSNVFYSVRKIR